MFISEYVFENNVAITYLIEYFYIMITLKLNNSQKFTVIIEFR